MSSILQDLRHALRLLARSPGFTLAAVLTLALGIGANTAVFSVINGLLLRAPAQVRDFDRLAAIYTSDASGPAYGNSSLPDVVDFAAGAPAFSGIAAYTFAPVVLSEGSGVTAAELVLGQAVTANYFDVLGVRLAAGRGFAADEGRAGGRGDVVVLGHSFWMSRFGGDASIVGRVVRLAGQPFTVIGIAPEGFGGLLPGVAPAFHVTMAAADAIGFLDPDARGDRGLFVVGRLAQGATLEQARAQLGAVAAALHAGHPQFWTDVRDQPRRVTVIPAAQATVPPQLRGPVAGFAGVLMAVVGAVLLIGCANIANLLLARASGRQREMGVRIALGAGRARLVRQMVTESLLLAGFGALPGVALAYAGTRALAALQLPLPVDLRLDVTPDLRVLGFTAVVAVVAGLAFGLAPALIATRRGIVAAMKSDVSWSSGRRLGLRGVLAAGQIAIAVVLLVAGGLLVRSLQSAQSIAPGFRTDGLLFVSLAQDENTTMPEERLTFQRELRARASALPGVRAASIAASLPLGLGQSRRSFAVEGYRAGAGEDMELNSTYVGPRYFEAMGTRLLRGREFTDADGPGAPAVAIVNEAFVRRFLDGADPIGRRLSRGAGDPFDIEIVGLAEDGKYRSLGEAPLPFVWLASDQRPSGFATLVVHANGPLAPLGEAVRDLAAEVDPDVAITGITTAREHLAFALLPQRVGSWLLGAFGLLGLALAALGIYGVMAVAVSHRGREIGVRLALGADPGAIVRMVVRQGMGLALAGLAAGLALAGLVSRFLAFLLFDIAPLDAPTFAITAITGVAVALLACWLPARRTTALDPVRALRSE